MLILAPLKALLFMTPWVLKHWQLGLHPTIALYAQFDPAVIRVDRRVVASPRPDLVKDAGSHRLSNDAVIEVLILKWVETPRR